MTGSTELSPRAIMRCVSLVGLSSLVCGDSASVPRDHGAAPANGKRNRADGATLRTHYGRTRPITRRDHSLEVIEEGRTASDKTPKNVLSGTPGRGSSNA